MIAVIAAGQDKDGASVRAYCKRPGEFWIDEDLEKYTEEAVYDLGFLGYRLGWKAIRTPNTERA